jgi:transcription elongation factor Elf1
MFKDKVSAKDRISVTIETEVVAARHPCPKCGGESKETSVPVEQTSMRVCSARDCRNKFDVDDLLSDQAQRALNKVKELNNPLPKFPCTVCGRESKEHNVDPISVNGARICSSWNCRTEFNIFDA